MKGLLFLGLVALLAYLIYQDTMQPTTAGASGPQPSPPEGASSSTAGSDFLSSLRSDGIAVIDQISGIVDDAITRVTDVVTGKADVVTAFADAIQRFEGYYVGSRSYRDNNPGNLEPPGGRANFYQGQIGLDGPYAVFDSYASGRRALEMDIRIKINRAKNAGQTILDIISVYAPPNENPTAQYADYVAKALGVTADTLISQIA